MSGRRAKAARREAAKARQYLERQFDLKNKGMPVTLWRRLKWIFIPGRRKRDLAAWEAARDRTRHAFVAYGVRQLGRAANKLMRGS